MCLGEVKTTIVIEWGGDDDFNSWQEELVTAELHNITFSSLEFNKDSW